MQKDKFDQLMAVAKFVIVTVGFGFVTLQINTEIQKREIEIKELDQMGKYVNIAVVENVGTRKRFADYFATVTRSEDLRALWKDYQRNVTKEYEDEKAAKTVKVEQAEQLAKAIDKPDVKIEKRLTKDTELARTLAEVNNINQELQVNPIDASQRAPEATSGAGWVYLGEYDKKNKIWVKTYFNIRSKQAPESLVKEDLRVTTVAINVRDSMPSMIGTFGEVIGNLKNGRKVSVSRVEGWLTSGYMWAAVSY
jgi:hypothetical protein